MQTSTRAMLWGETLVVLWALGSATVVALRMILLELLRAMRSALRVTLVVLLGALGLVLLLGVLGLVVRLALLLVLLRSHVAWHSVGMHAAQT